MAADIWAAKIYESRFGDIPIDIQLTQDQIERALVAVPIIGRDGALVQDQGLEARRTRCRIIFWENDADSDEPFDQLTHLERFAAFDKEQRLGARDFVHPLFGTYRAYVNKYTVDADATAPNVLVLDVDMLEDGLDPRALSSPAQPPAGAAAVSAAADKLELARADLEVPVPEVLGPTGGTTSEDAVTAVNRWETDPDIAAGEVNGDLSALSLRMAEEDALLEDEGGVDAMPAIRACNVLHSSVRRAAEARQRDQPAIIETALTTTLPLRVHISRMYADSGLDQFQLFDEIMRINSIKDPSRVPAGTTLRRPSANPRGISSLPGRRGA
jgi:hypothetical protein